MSLTATSLDEELVSLLERRFIGSAVAHSSLPPFYAFPRYAGLILLHLDTQNEIELFWGHTSPSFAVGYHSDAQTAPKALISRLPEEQWGHSAAFGGTHLRGAS